MRSAFRGGSFFTKKKFLKNSDKFNEKEPDDMLTTISANAGNPGDALTAKLEPLLAAAREYEISDLLNAVRVIAFNHNADINCFEEEGGVLKVRISANRVLHTTHEWSMRLRSNVIRFAA